MVFPAFLYFDLKRKIEKNLQVFDVPNMYQ
jgi:hypothetical protein